MVNIFDYYDEFTYLSHHGIKGQKWGVRRYQNPDGTLTEAGRKRYGVYGADNRPSISKIETKRLNLADKHAASLARKDQEYIRNTKIMEEFNKKYKVPSYNEANDPDEVEEYIWDLRHRRNADPQLSKDIDAFDEAEEYVNKAYMKYYKAGKQYALDSIQSEYGTKAVNDLKYRNIKAGLTITGLIIASPIIIPAAIIYGGVSLASGGKKNKDK